ncbi:hypothetical protein BS78_02G133400 [Paspalum vaginatum]|nr:hypothetical protein BS78_02G133400 [Paspalum vaginatum]
MAVPTGACECAGTSHVCAARLGTAAAARPITCAPCANPFFPVASPPRWRWRREGELVRGGRCGGAPSVRARLLAIAAVHPPTRVAPARPPCQPYHSPGPRGTPPHASHARAATPTGCGPPP